MIAKSKEKSRNKTALFDVGININDKKHPFSNQLPFFNWFYPFDEEKDISSAPLRNLEINWTLIKRTSAYFHIPFCKTLCSFCPFVKGLYKHEDEIEFYLQALIKEIQLKQAFIGIPAPDSIFIGGGTPSVLSASQILRLGENIHRHFQTSGVTEFAAEVEVKSVTPEKLQALKDIGVNRLSFGVQTFSEAHREAFNLDAPLVQVKKVADWANNFFPYTNIDIIYGMAGQSYGDLERDIEQAILLKTTTIDFYPLNNLAAQIRMYDNFRKLGFKILDAQNRLTYRKVIRDYMLSMGYARINGYGYARNAGTNNKGFIQNVPKFLYHDILYGYSNDCVLGYGSAAVSQIPKYNLYNNANRQDYIKTLIGDGMLPFVSYKAGPSKEKGVVTFPYRGQLDKLAISWEDVPDETLKALGHAKEAGLIIDNKKTIELTESGWLFYVNLMYFLMPFKGKKWISDRLEQRMKDKRECENTSLS
jgi:coproporphyrinogen III oxidase-like Fe-S oxidoreductase